MATPTWITGFESGAISLYGGGICHDVIGTCTADSSIKHTGTYSLKCVASSGGGAYINKDSVGSPTCRTISFYFYYEDLPAAGNQHIVAYVIALGYFLNLSFNYSDSKLYVGEDLNLTYAGPTITADAWHCVDLRIDVASATWTLDWTVDGVAQTQRTFSHSASTITTMNLGQRASNAATIYIDDVMTSQTSGDYPLAASGIKVYGISPNADGSHNAGTNIIEDNSGNDIGVVTAYNLLDEVPMNTSTDYVRQSGTTGSYYAEVLFTNPTVSGTILGVSALIAFGENDVTNDGATKAYDNDSQETVVYSGDMGYYSYMTYKDKIITVPSGGWTTTHLNALKMRIGYSTNVTSPPRWHSLMFEIATTQQALVKIITE